MVAAQHSRKDCAVVSHDDLVQNGANDTPVHFYLFGSRTKHLWTEAAEEEDDSGQSGALPSRGISGSTQSSCTRQASTHHVKRVGLSRRLVVHSSRPHRHFLPVCVAVDDPVGRLALHRVKRPESKMWLL